MTLLLAPTRRSFRRTTFTPPAPTSEDWTDIVAALTPRKWLRMNEASGATAVSSGSAAGNGTIVNPSNLQYSQGALVLDSDGGSSFGWPGIVPNPPYITITDPVTTASWTIGGLAQIDAHAAQYVLLTKALASSTAGAYSCEFRDDGSGTAMRPYKWTSNGTIAQVLQGTPNSLPIGVPVPVWFVQHSDADDGGSWIYVGNTLVAENTAIKTFTAPPAGTAYVSAWAGGVAPFNGLMAEVLTFNRALSAAEIATLNRAIAQVVAFKDFTAAADEGASGTIDPRPHTHPEVGYTLAVLDEGPVVNLTPSGLQLNYATGSVAADTDEEQTVRITKTGQTADATLTVTVRDTSTPPSEFAACYEGAGGTVVNVGSFTDRETETNYSGGGNRYNASNASWRIRWTGDSGGSLNRSVTTPMHLIRLGIHNGGCFSRGLLVGNVQSRDNRDTSTGSSTWNKNFSLYPMEDGGPYRFEAGGSGITNFKIESSRSHGLWDVYRPTTGADDITISRCWDTLVRDDWVENDLGKNMLIEDCLVGDTIGPNDQEQRGAWVIYSNTGGPGTAHVFIDECLLWVSQQYAPGRNNPLNGFVCGNPFKVDKSRTARIHITNSVLMVDHATESGGDADLAGNPLAGLLPGPSNPGAIGTLNGQTGESSNNLILFRDLANLGKYARNAASAVWPRPPGFTLVMGAEAESEWNLRVANWKADHQEVRRFNNKVVPRPTGASTSSITVDDVG